MTRKILAIHLTWALLATAAWWLGLQSKDDAARVPDPSRTRLAANAESVNLGSARDIGRTAPRVTAAAAEVAAWLDTWRSADGRVSPERMSAAVLAALRDSDPVRGLRNFAHLLENLTPENAAAAVLTLKSNAGASDSGVWLELLCAAWGAKDGASALDTLTDDPDRHAAIAAWAGSDPAAAQAWLESLSLGHGDNGLGMEEDKRDLQSSLVAGMARRDVDEAVRYIASRDERERDGLAKAVAREMFRHGGKASAEWAANLDDSTMRASALEMVARNYMAAVPAEGATWAAENATAPDMRAAVGRVADRIAENDVIAAYAWTQQLPASPGQEEAYQQVFSEWARQDPTASSQELLRMTPGRSRDQAIHSFSRSLVREDPESALAWTSAISDPAQRLDSQISVAREWHSAAPEAAIAWMTTNLPADARAKALASD